MSEEKRISHDLAVSHHPDGDAVETEPYVDLSSDRGGVVRVCADEAPALIEELEALVDPG